MRRVLVLVGLAVAAGGIGFGVAAEPAAADDCSRRLKEAGYIEGLTDDLVVEDCLRTGGNFGRVVGVVVGTTGVLIAAAGLPGVKIPDASGLTRSATPTLRECLQAMEVRDEIDRSLDQLRDEKERIGREWDDHRRRAAAFGARFQAELARRHAQSEWAVNSMIGRAVTYAAISGLIGQAAALVAGTSVGLAGAAPALSRLQIAGRIAGGTAVLGGGTLGVDYVTGGDLLGARHLYNRLVEIWSGWPRWIERAEQFNREMEQWERDRTGALRKTQQDLAAVTQRYQALVPACTQHLQAFEPVNPKLGAATRAMLQRWRSQMDNPVPTSFPEPRIPRLVIRPWLEHPGIAGTRFGISPGYLQTMNISRDIASRVGAVARFQATSASATFPGAGIPSIGQVWHHAF